MFSLAVSLSKL